MTLPSLSAFTPAALAADPGSAEFVHAACRWALEEGIVRLVEELNEVGHTITFALTSTHGNWQIYRGPLPGGDHYLQLSWEADEHELMITCPMTDQGWERSMAASRPELTPRERAAQEVRDRFYQRAGDLVSRKYDDWPQLSPAEQALMTVFLLEQEVNNGGFSQYYVNTGGHQVEVLAERLEAIGAPGAARLVRRSMEIVPPPYTRELSEAQWDALEAGTEELNALDDAYYALEEDLATLAVNWVEANGA